MSIKTKRAYDDATKEDGFRVLVDRLWPRGVSKEEAKIDLWLKEIAPSTELRKWFDHDPEKWSEFQKKFKVEINDNEDAWNQLKEVVKKHSTVTLVFAAKDEEHDNAVVLQKMLEEHK